VFGLSLRLFQNDSETSKSKSGSGGGKPDMVRLKHNLQDNFQDDVSRATFTHWCHTASLSKILRVCLVNTGVYKCCLGPAVKW